MMESVRIIVGLIFIAIILACFTLCLNGIIPFWAAAIPILIIRGLVPYAPRDDLP